MKRCGLPRRVSCNRSITEIRTDMRTKKYTITSLQMDSLPFPDEDMLKNCSRFIREKYWELKQKMKEKVKDKTK